jgi:hypothetical protein
MFSTTFNQLKVINNIQLIDFGGETSSEAATWMNKNKKRG